MKKYKLNNFVSGKQIFSGNENKLIEFVKKIAVENGDENKAISTATEAIEYVNGYCDNLDLTEIK